MLPLTRVKQMEGNVRHGCAFRIERRGTDYLVQSVMGVAIYPSEGCADAEAALAAATERDIESRTGELAAGNPALSQHRDPARALLVTRSRLGAGLRAIRSRGLPASVRSAPGPRAGAPEHTEHFRS